MDRRPDLGKTGVMRYEMLSERPSLTSSVNIFCMKSGAVQQFISNSHAEMDLSID